jgi:hypothetical protein
MLGRRFLLLVAVLMGLTALAASVAPREPLVRDRREATPSPTPTAQASADAPSAVRTVEKTIQTAEDPARVTVRQGDLVQLTVHGDELDSVQLMGQVEPIDPESDAVFELFADEPGAHPIVLVESQRRVGTLVVRGNS